MGYLKEGGILVNCDNVCEIVTDITGNDLTVVLSWPLANGGANVLKGTLTWSKGAANSFTKTEAEYQAIFADAVAIGGGAVSGGIALPTVEQEVTATGAYVGIITPGYGAAFAAP